MPGASGKQRKKMLEKDNVVIKKKVRGPNIRRTHGIAQEDHSSQLSIVSALFEVS
jgi:hypothetical protein